jgi:predicted metal-dependent peptidase
MLEKDKEERRLSKIKISIMRNPKFALWSGLMTVGKTKISDDVPTACTNGRDEIYGREFVKKLDDKELAFVMLHETLHKAYRHLYTWRKLWEEEPILANAACDYVINLELQDMMKDTGALEFPILEGRQIGLVDEKVSGQISLVDEKVSGLGKRLEFQEFINRSILAGLIFLVLGGAAKYLGIMPKL